LLSVPQQARHWRLQHKERATHAALLDGWSHLAAGRYVRARKAAELAVSIEASITRSGEVIAQAEKLRTLAHLLAAESAHALQDTALREMHFQQALAESGSRDAQEAREGVQLRAAQWALHSADATGALHWLDQLPQGAARRTVALRLRFRAARLAGKPQLALEMVRMLAKHRAMSEVAGRSLAQALALELVRTTHDIHQIQRAWDTLDTAEQTLPDVALAAAERWLALGGEAAQSRVWLLPVWNAMMESPDVFNLAQRVRLIRLLERGFVAQSGLPDAEWLARIESAQLTHPRDAMLQYLVGRICMRLGLWGKAQQMLKQAQALLKHPALRRDAWCALAELAEQRQDAAAATEAYRQALLEAVKE
jgi:HemY protein